MKRIPSILIALCAAAGITGLGYISATCVDIIWTWLGFPGFAHILWIIYMVLTAINALLAGSVVYVECRKNGAAIADAASAKARGLFNSVKARFA